MRIKIDEIFRYYVYITHLFLKGKLNYPNPLFGSPVSDNEVLDSWKTTKKMIESKEAPNKFNLYVHIPFCVCKCLFCMSASFQTTKVKSVVAKHLLDLYEEMEMLSPIMHDIPVSSFYLGGGTPSLLESPQIVELFSRLKRSFDLKDTRIIFEASPQTLNREKLEALKESGITELALGVQSFDDEVLRLNTRPQTSIYVKKIFSQAREIGIPSITLDMMVGLPHQTDDSAIQSLKEAIQLRPDGIMLNSFLALHHTVFMMSGGQEKKRKSISKKAHDLLLQAGYSATRQGYRLDWSESDDKRRYETQESDNLLGLGYGAFSHAYGTLKYQRLYDVNDYFRQFENKAFVKDTDQSFLLLAKKPFYSKQDQKYVGIKLDKHIEMCTFAYSNISNLSFKDFKKRFGEDFTDVFRSNLEILEKKGMLVVQKDKIKLLKKDPHHFQIIKVFFMDKDYIDRIISDDEKYNADKDYLPEVKDLCRYE